MPKYQKTKEDLETELREQLLAFRASTRGYDAGDLWEAKRLATSVYTLLHEGTGRTRSLFGLLGKKSGLKLISSKVVPPGNPIKAQSTLIVMMRASSDGTAQYVPMLDDHPFASQFNWLPFGTWWEEVIFHPLSSITLSRKNVVFSLRSQDGGSHVDDALTNESYAEFKNSGDPTVRTGPQGVNFFGDPNYGSPVTNGVPATMRQIAWEVDRSLAEIGL